MAQDKVLDVRDIPPFERHPKILDIWEQLAVGDTLELINDHDPRPLHYQFMHEYEGEFEWHSEEKGPREWVARIKKVAPPRGQTGSATE